MPDVPTLSFVPLFDSSAFAPSEGYAAWRHAHGDLSRTFDTRPYEPFACSTCWLSVGAVDLGYARFTAQHWTRTAAMATRDDYDQLIINCRFGGTAKGEMGGRSLDAPDGSIVITDMTQPQAHASAASDTVALVLTRPEAETIFGDVRSLHGHVVAPHHATLVLSHLHSLRRNAQHYPISAGAMIGNTVLDLITMAIKTSRAETVTDHALQERVLEVRLRDAIARDLGSPTLTIARLCRTLGASRSTLYRLMEAEGGIQAFIRNARLEKVAEALRTPDSAQPLSALAQRWGFCDAAYLGRSFRETYGITPGDYREAHRKR